MLFQLAINYEGLHLLQILFAVTFIYLTIAYFCYYKI